MVAKYPIFGAQVGSHYLAMATLTVLFGGIYAATSGPKKTLATPPPIHAASSDEEDFIKKFLDEANAGEKKQ